VCAQTDWVGRAIATALGLDIDNKRDKARVGGMIKAWLSAGSLRIVEGMVHREKKKFVEVREEV
jgi:hypothetical protein